MRQEQLRKNVAALRRLLNNRRRRRRGLNLVEVVIVIAIILIIIGVLGFAASSVFSNSKVSTTQMQIMDWVRR